MTSVHLPPPVPPPLGAPAFPPAAATVRVEFGARSQRGRLKPVNEDHYLIMRLGPHQQTKVELAPLVDVNAAARDLSHILTDTIGMRGSSGPTIDLERISLDHDDRVLVCTNGLTDAVDEDEIGGMLALYAPPDAQCRRLVDLAVDRGSDDDVTVLMARYHIPD